MPASRPRLPLVRSTGCLSRPRRRCTWRRSRPRARRRLLSSGARTHHIPTQPAPDDGSHRSGQSGGRILGLTGFLVELVLPVSLSGALLLLLASYTSRWDLHSPIGLGFFGVLLVALSLFVSLGLDALTLEGRRRSNRQRLLNRAGPRWR